MELQPQITTNDILSCFADKYLKQYERLSTQQATDFWAKHKEGFLKAFHSDDLVGSINNYLEGISINPEPKPVEKAVAIYCHNYRETCPTLGEITDGVADGTIEVLDLEELRERKPVRSIFFTTVVDEEATKWEKGVRTLIDKIRCSLFGKRFHVVVEWDKEHGKRLYLQIQYHAICNNTGKEEKWHGRKQYLSKHMMKDEIVKICFGLFKDAINHEVMEGFRFEDNLVFNPHTPFDALVKASKKEIKRT